MVYTTNDVGTGCVSNICFLNMPIEFYSPVTGGAIATIIANVAGEFENRGHQVRVVTRTDGKPFYSAGKIVKLDPCGAEDLSFLQRRISGVRWHLNTWDWPYYDYYRAAFTKALRNLDLDVLICFNDLVSPIHLRGLFPKARIMVWLQNEQRTRLQDLPASQRATDRWLTCSDYIREWTTREHGFPSERITTVPSGVDLKDFSPRPGFLETRKPVRVLFVGRLDPNKGVDIAVDAVAALRKEGLPVTMTVAGGLWFYGNHAENPYLIKLRGKFKNVDAEHLGHVSRDKISAVFREHDIVCVLSRSNEPFGLVVLEAMASGCAVIASNRGGLPEACGGAAVLVNPDHLEEVIAALRQFVANAPLLSAAKQRCVARARKAGWHTSVDTLEQILTEFLGA